MHWNPDGKSLLLIGKDQFCVTYLSSCGQDRDDGEETKSDNEDNYNDNHERSDNDVENEALNIKGNGNKPEH